jgi:hypothetical protein
LGTFLDKPIVYQQDGFGKIKWWHARELTMAAVLSTAGAASAPRNGKAIMRPFENMV